MCVENLDVLIKFGLILKKNRLWENDNPMILEAFCQFHVWQTFIIQVGDMVSTMANEQIILSNESSKQLIDSFC